MLISKEDSIQQNTFFSVYKKLVIVLMSLKFFVLDIYSHSVVSSVYLLIFVYFIFSGNQIVLWRILNSKLM